MGKFDPATMTERERHLYERGFEAFASWVVAHRKLTVWRSLFYVALVGNIVQFVASFI